MNNNFIELRKLKKSDISNIFELSNQDYVRKYSINKDKILWEDHIKWFENILKSDLDYFYIVTENTSENEEKFYGQVRFKINTNNGDCEVSISLNKNIQGRGMSKYILKESLNLLFSEATFINVITAYVNIENLVSIKLFQGVGFQEISKANDMLRFVIIRSDFYETR
ncbi:MAG: GNAT family N-acetyltransferase [Lachnospirales bacterium]